MLHRVGEAERGRRRFRRLVVGIPIAILLMCAGCGGGDTPTPAGGEPLDTPGSATTNPAGSTAPPGTTPSNSP